MKHHSAMATGYLFLVLIGLVPMASAQAATLHVEQDGTGDFLVIQDAVDAAAVGDTILVGPGRYSDLHAFTTNGTTTEVCVSITVDSLTIRGTDQSAVVIGPAIVDHSGDGPSAIKISWELVSYAKLESLSCVNARNGIYIFGQVDLDNVLTDSCWNGIIALASRGTRITNCEILGSPFHGIATGTGVEGFLVSNSEFRDNFLGIGFNRTQNATVVGCTFEGGGVQFGDHSTGTVSDCVLTGELGGVAVLRSQVDLRNTRMLGDRVSLFVGTFSHLTGTNNVLAGGYEATIRINGGSTADFHGNHILKKSGPSVLCEAYVLDPVQIDFTNNYWGTASADSIRAWILDGEDLHNPPLDPNYSEVLFEPFYDHPIPTQPESVGGLKSRYRD